MARMTAFRTVWTAFVDVYEETLVLIAGNLGALALNVPVFLIVLVIATSDDDAYTQLAAIVAAWLLPFLPTPGNLALANLTRVAAGPDVPRFAEFRSSLSRNWRLALRCSVVSVLVLGALVWNV